MTETQIDPTITRGRRPDGPPAGVLASLALLFTLASVVVPLAIAGTGYPTPATSAVATSAYFAGHAAAATLTGFFAFAASVPIGIYAATVYARQLRLGIRVPGPGISFLGGIAASILLSVSGLITWVLASVHAGVPDGVVKLLATLSFALGGIGFAGGIGLLIAGIAVPVVVLRLLPRWLGWVGLVIAALAEISFLAMLWNGFDVLLPVARFLGLLWLAAVGFLLPHDRREVSRRG